MITIVKWIKSLVHYIFHTLNNRLIFYLGFLLLTLTDVWNKQINTARKLQTRWIKTKYSNSTGYFSMSMFSQYRHLILSFPSNICYVYKAQNLLTEFLLDDSPWLSYTDKIFWSNAELLLSLILAFWYVFPVGPETAYKNPSADVRMHGPDNGDYVVFWKYTTHNYTYLLCKYVYVRYVYAV